MSETKVPASVASAGAGPAPSPARHPLRDAAEHAIEAIHEIMSSPETPWRCTEASEEHCLAALAEMRDLLDRATGAEALAGRPAAPPADEKLFRDLAYAIALVEDRVKVEAPVNQELLRARVARLTKLMSILFQDGFSAAAAPAAPPAKDA